MINNNLKILEIMLYILNFKFELYLELVTMFTLLKKWNKLCEKHTATLKY